MALELPCSSSLAHPPAIERKKVDTASPPSASSRPCHRLTPSMSALVVALSLATVAPEGRVSTRREHSRHAPRRESPSAGYYGSVALAGALSCSVTHSLVVPIDVVKIRMQTDASLAGPRAAVAAVMAGAPCQCLGSRIRPFFNGVGATSAGYLLQGAAKFGGYELFKRSALAALHERGERGAAFARQFALPIMLTSAACAEVVASAALCPLEVLKLRLQTDPALASLGLRRGALSLARHEGAAVFFKGFVPIALRQVPYTACKLVSFELAVGWMRALVAASDSGTHASDRHRGVIVLASGLLAGAAAAVVSQPFDLLLTRLCGSGQMASECLLTTGVIQQLRYLIDLGPGAFAGLPARLGMVSVMTAGQFVIFDSLRQVLNCPA